MSVSRGNSTNPFMDSENGKTLSELGFKNGEDCTLSDTKLATAKVPLFLDDMSNINARALYLFGSLFDSLAVPDPLD